MKRRTGNLIDLAEQGEFDVIVHGCNCYHAMGGGIAKEIAFRYPEAKLADLRTPYADRKKLGNFSQALIELEDGTVFTIINAYTQFRWSSGEDVFEYDCFETFLNRLAGFVSPPKSSVTAFRADEVRIGFPMIGCGLAGGDSNRILPMIEKFAKDVEAFATVTLVQKD